MADRSDADGAPGGGGGPTARAAASTDVPRPMWRQLFDIDPDAGQSLQSQLRQALVKAILDQRVPPGTPLPSSRALAGELGIARNTVVLAYQHLVDESYLVARERHGYFVNPEMLHGRVPRRAARERPECTPAPPPGGERCVTPPEARPTRREPAVVMDLLAQRNIEQPLDWQRYEYPFIYGQVDGSLFPVNDWREAVRLSLRVDAIGRWTQDRVDHDDDLLVEQILTRVLPRRGVWASPDELLITTGAQNALFLIAQLLLDRHADYGIEDPCYVDARNIFSLFGRRAVPFPVGPEGVETDERLAGCRLVYVTPSHQCPTATTMPLAARERLLNQAARHDVTVIEDDYESELNFTGAPTPALKSLDPDHRVVYVGSLSKTLAPGLRIGFMVGPPGFIRQARALRRLMYRHPPTNTQRTVAHFLALGHHDSALLRITRAYRERFLVMQAALAAHELLASRAPTYGGSSFWVRLPPGVDAQRLQRDALERSVVLNAGDHYFADATPPAPYCRLGFSSIDATRIAAGIDRLVELANAQVR